MKKAYNVLFINTKTSEIVQDFIEISKSKSYLIQKYKFHTLSYPKYKVIIKKHSKGKECVQLNLLDLFATKC